jgi:glycosyltransferase involved in cell wall biosynthesis
MRIAFTVHKLPPDSLGGTEIYTLSLARSLAREGHDVAIFHPQPGAASLQHVVGEDGVDRWRAPLPADRQGENPVSLFWHTFRDHAIERAFSTFLDKVQPELVHFQHVQAVSARLIEMAAGLPRVATLHDYWYYCANSQLVRPDRQPCAGPSAGCRNCVDCATVRADLAGLSVLRPLVALPLAYRNAYLRRMAQQIDLFITPSHFLRSQYVGQGFPGDKIVVLENGMDLARLGGKAGDKAKAEAQVEAQVEAKAEAEKGVVRPHFGYLGAFAWQKGAHVLVEAFNRLPPDAASLTLYGSETAFPDYAAQVRAAIRHPQVRVAGPAPFDQVGAVLRQFDALITPSLWYENSPLVIQEAYALGIPVIASNLGALAEKVQDGVSGRLFPAGDSVTLAAILQEISAEPALLARYRQQINPPPTIEEHTRQIEQLYRQLVMRGK